MVTYLAHLRETGEVLPKFLIEEAGNRARQVLLLLLLLLLLLFLLLLFDLLLLIFVLIEVYYQQYQILATNIYNTKTNNQYR